MSKISTPPLVGLTAGQALERLESDPQLAARAALERSTLSRLEGSTPAGRLEVWRELTESGLLSTRKQGLSRRLVGAARTWVRQRLCPHTNATAEKLALVDAGMTPLYRCHCEACGRIWMEVGK